VYIIWDKPNWLKNVKHIKQWDPHRLKAMNALNKLIIAATDPNISDDFILMNDDFYILHPTNIKYYHQWNISDHVKRRYSMHSVYAKLLKKTFGHFPQGKDYSLHVPFIYNKQKLIKLFQKYDFCWGLLIRNMYGNEYKVRWSYMKDCKVFDINKFNIKNWDLFLSSDDKISNNILFKQWLYRKFPNKSKYEKVSIGRYPTKRK
jgi:hypothetical protein